MALKAVVKIISILFYVCVTWTHFFLLTCIMCNVTVWGLFGGSKSAIKMDVIKMTHIKSLFGKLFHHKFVKHDCPVLVTVTYTEL